MTLYIHKKFSVKELAEYVDIMLICPKFQLHIPTNFSFFIS